MVPRLKILSNVVERLTRLQSSATGRLYGVMCDNTLIILSFSLNVPECSLANYDMLQLNMPVEIDLCGVLLVDQCEEAIVDAFKDIDVTDNPLLLEYSLGTTDLRPFFYIHQKLEPADSFQIISEETIWEQFKYVRLVAGLPIITQKGNILEIIQESRKNIASGKAGFIFPGSNVHLLSSDGDTSPVLSDELRYASNSSENSGNGKDSSKRTSAVVDVIQVDLMLKACKDKVGEGDAQYAPVIQHVKRAFECQQFNLKIDALALVNRDADAAHLYAILVESICRNLKLIERSFETQIDEDNDCIKLPEPLHFRPSSLGHFLTLAYPVGTDEEELREYRESLHKVLDLDMTRPFIRRGNAVRFSTDAGKNDPLVNPHEAISTASMSDGKLSIVDGLYSYHHYMQDEFDDNGWGCAYRSLQTIVSWYRFQGYTDRPIPTHRMIQKCLVDIGDKPSSFIGSRQWIGSTEVGFVLESMFGISVKVLCASSGEEMPMFASELHRHFQTQGTPVMIGGGVLAHTILGIYKESLTDVKFLILDPHYTGSDNLNTIINKGWCSWKTKDFWKKDAFYNMCLPQRPVCT
ncbi:ufm1-specific protease 2 [Orussus abietinus]|uniref:ufm1-specific protease 2 n=1 Tax=Orussus abietinus TaxID=222816 RepID=UPI0006259D09|nr:ufm1-specific protease 2 [Orussus abietinus]XP_012285608.1 ufm1-specific protease 2 [Orussus abietinus]